MNSEDDIEHVEQAANLSVIYDGNTPTEIEPDYEQNEKNSEDEIDQADNLSVFHDDQIRIKTELDESLSLKPSFQFDVSLQLQKKIKNKPSMVTFPVCIIINNKFVFSASYISKLVVYNKDGSYNKIIKLPRDPWCISGIKDNDVAVSYNQPYIDVVCINTGQVKNRIVTNGNTYGISYLNGMLYVIINTKEVHVINLTGDTIRSFTGPSSTVWHLTTDTDRLFLIDSRMDIVYCCDLYGSVIWKYTDDEMMSACGVTTDGNGYVYLAFSTYNNLVVVSPDGKHHKNPLSWTDGLQYPTGIFCDKSENCLMLFSEELSKAFLYEVIYKTKC